MARILFRQDGLVDRDAPIDAQRIVENADARVGLRMVELVTLILEYGRGRQHSKTMGKTLGDEELAVVVLGEFHGDMLSVGGTALADVDRNIEYGTTYTAHEFTLGERWTLEVESSHDTIGGHALVILYEGNRCNLRIEVALRERLEEIAPGIGKDARFDNI